MRRYLLLGILLLAGCEGVTGPRQHRADTTPIDDPRLSIDQQQQRGRDRLALPDTSNVLPRAYNDSALLPGPQGR